MSGQASPQEAIRPVRRLWGCVLEEHSSTYLSPISSWQASSMVRRKHNPDRWDALRGVIARLYEEEGLTLKEVMGVMANKYSFDAT